MPIQTPDIGRELTLDTAVKEASALKAGGRLLISGLHSPASAFFTASLFAVAKRPVLAILPGEEEASVFAEDLKFFLGPEDVCLYPSTETLPFDNSPVHPDIEAARVGLLYRLSESGQKPFITIASASTVMQRVAPKESLKDRAIDLKKGVEYPHDALIAKLTGLGYTRMSLVEERGEMSVRGHILDIFPPMSANPLRIEFFGDEAESIRTFDVNSQRSLKNLIDVRILPALSCAGGLVAFGAARQRLMERADELGLERKAWEPLSTGLRDGDNMPATGLLPLFHERLDTIFDYINDGAVIALIETEGIEARMNRFETSVRDAAEKLISKKEFFVRPEALYMDSAEAASLIDRRASIGFELISGKGMELKSSSNLDIRQELTLKKKGESPLLKPLAERISGWLEEGRSVCLTAHNRAQAERTVELLEGYGFSPGVIRGPEILGGRPPALAVAIGSLSTGFRLPGASIIIISEEEVFGTDRVKRRAPPPKKLNAFSLQLQDLDAGDAVVHSKHGIGLYRGLKRLSVDNVENEFLILEYRDHDKLYLPVLRTDLINTYHGFEGKEPNLDKLGGTGWARTKRRVKKAVERLAGELLKLYAERQAAGGFAFSPPDALFREFEASFEYDETPDQA
ncbi:MAG: hypothetical protein HZB83_03285, partial [Deltaproteobacteria bacterium]|nr:hypothetical protein [Deltaproteobacteria bacterium]